MATCLIVRLPLTADEEETTVKTILGSGEMPPGIVAQIAGSDAEGACVITLWDTEEGASFFAKNVVPKFKEAGFKPTSVTKLDVHRVYQRAGSNAGLGNPPR
jgi:hypothetical protein